MNVNVEALLERVRKIDATIRWYEARREAVLREDAEYANYLDRYAAMYQDNNPLPIQLYYQYLANLDALYGIKEPDDHQIYDMVDIEERLAI